MMRADLVADDQTEVYVRGHRLWVRCPRTIRGKLEVRGLGIVSVKPHAACPLVLVVDLKPDTRTERLPEPGDLTVNLLDHRLARISLDPLRPSAPSVLRAAFQHLT